MHTDRENSLLTELATLMPPPAADIVSPPWAQAPSRVGFSFPSDYQAFAARYGFGGWSSDDKPFVVGIFGPTIAEPWEATGFEGFVADQALTGLLPTVGPGYDFVPFPEPGSLLTFGGTEVNDLLMWQVTGPDSDKWRVVALSGHDNVMHQFDGGMLAFLVALIRGDLELSVELMGRRPVWLADYDWSTRIGVTGGPATAQPGWL